MRREGEDVLGVAGRTRLFLKGRRPSDSIGVAVPFLPDLVWMTRLSRRFAAG